MRFLLRVEPANHRIMIAEHKRVESMAPREPDIIRATICAISAKKSAGRVSTRYPVPLRECRCRRRLFKKGGAIDRRAPNVRIIAMVMKPPKEFPEENVPIARFVVKGDESMNEK